MKHILLLTYFALFTVFCHAQPPQWFVSSTTGNNNYPFNNTSGNKVAWLYLPSDFGAPPAGTITDIYFAVASSATNASFTNFTIKMGLTSQTAWTSSTYPSTGLTTVVSGNPYVMPSVAPTWLKIPLTTPFVFDGTSSIMVLVESQSFSNGFTVYQNSLTGRRIYGSYGNASGSGFDGTYAGFGFDIVTCPSPVISAQPQNKNVCEGTSTNFSVTAANTSFYQWQVNTGSGFTNISNGGIYSGATTSTLSLATIPASYNNYQYRCRLTGACNNPMNSGVATLTIMPGASILSQTLTDSICETAATSMNVSAFGSITGYQWQYAISTVGTFSDVPAAYPFANTTTPTLDILNVHDSLNGYVFRCIVSAIGQCSGATTTPIPLTVLTPPDINSDGPKDHIGVPNADATYSITVNGQDFITYWQASADGISYSNINDNTLYKGTKTSTLLVIAPPLSMSNWWFRAIIKSTDPGCGIFHDTSAPAQLKMQVPGSVSGVFYDGGITIAPNPANGPEIFIDNRGDAKTVSMVIIDNIGKTIRSENISLVPGNTNTVNISQLAPGIYTVRFTDDTGQMTNTRFTKQ